MNQSSGKSKYIPARALLLSSFCVALVAFVLVNLILVANQKNIVEPLTQESLGSLDTAAKTGKPGSWWMAHSYLQQRCSPDIVIFGSSQMGGLQAADAHFLNKTLDFVRDHRAVYLEHLLSQRLPRQVNAFTCALPGAMISDHYLASKALFRPGLTPKVVIIGISPRDFMDNALKAPGLTESYLFFSKFVDASAMSNHAFPDLISRAEWFMSDEMPLRRLLKVTTSKDQEPDQGEVQNAVQGSQLLSALFTSGNIRPGQCLVGPNMPDIFVDNTREYKRRYRNENSAMLQAEFVYLNSLLADLRARGIKTVIVGMPLVTSNRAQLSPQFWSRFHNEITGLCTSYGATWLDLGDARDYSVRDFVDTVHLNARGGAKLAAAMAECIAKDRLVVDLLCDGKAQGKVLAGSAELTQ